MLLYENNKLPDINSYFAANQALPESENLQSLLEYRKLIQTSLDGFWVVRTKDARILEANDAFCNIVGYSREELMTMSISDLEIDESPAETAAHIKKIMEVGRNRFETHCRHKQGHQVNLEVSVSHSEFDGGTNYVFARDITARKRTEDALYFIAQRGWMDSAENFFDALAQYLGEALGVDYVVIDRLDKTPGIAETVALYAKGAIVPNMRYDLKGTPCENVMGRKFCLYPQGIQQLFPDDTLLVEMGAESYAGIPLWDSAGQPIGLIAVMDGKPLSDERSIFKLLQLVATRAAAELERERSDRMLRERELEFRTLAENMPDNLIRYDRQCRVQYMNPALRSSLAPEILPVLGKSSTESYPGNDAVAEYQRVIERVIATGDTAEKEILVPNPQGEICTHHIRFVAERDDNGEIVGALSIGRDMTERYRMEQEIAKSEAALRSLTDSAPFSIIRYDLEGRMRYMNSPMLQYFGIPATELIEKLPSEVWPDGRFAEIDRGIAQVPKTKTEILVEFSELGAEGKTLHHQVWLVPEKDTLGEVVGIIAFGLDITERKLAEALLVQRECEFRTLAENLPDNIVRYNREGVTAYVNPVLERTLGDSAAAMIGTTPREYFPDGSYEDYAQLLDTVLVSGEAGELEKILPGPDGKASIHQIRMVPERGENGEVVGVLTIGRDMTERMQAEKELRESESRFRILFESATDCMLILDMDGLIVDINRTGYERLGYQEHEMLGRKIAEFDTPEYAPLVSDRLAKLGKKGTAIFESAHVCKDGSFMPVEINTRTIQLGGESRYFSVIRDITQRKHAERQLRELTAHLLTVREEEKAYLAREIHDDLGSTLAALNLKLLHLLDVEFSEDMKKKPLFARLESMLPLLGSAIAATRRIITDMRPDVLDNLGLFAALKWQAEQFYTHTDIGCRIVCANDHGCEDCKGCEYQLDKTQSINLFRIFQEALTNVSRHSGASGVEAGFHNTESAIVLSIRDNGRGLPEGHTIAATSYGIRGMRERVRQMGGEIEFDSPPDGGFSVIVRVPRLFAS